MQTPFALIAYFSIVMKIKVLSGFLDETEAIFPNFPLSSIKHKFVMSCLEKMFSKEEKKTTMKQKYKMPNIWFDYILSIRVLTT